MPAEPIDDLLAFLLIEALTQLVEREMDDIVMMDLLGRELLAHFEPDAVKQIDFLRVR
jgi:hypothetical protein